MNLDEIKVSKYENTYSMFNVEVSLVDELQKVKNGFYKEQISKCREFVNTGNLLGYKALKKNLPALTFSGTFIGAHKKDNLKIYNRLIVIDIDNINSDIGSKREQLLEDNYVISSWISPSGKGLKALIELSLDQANHKIAFDQLVVHFKNQYNLDVDKTGSDLCRLCYISYDKDLVIKTSHRPFELTGGMIEPVKEKEEKEERTFSGFYSTSDQKINSSYNKRLFIKIQKYLTTRKLSITEQYDDWYRVALAIANSFHPDIGKTYFLQISSLDQNYDEYKCLELLDYCYRHKREGAISFRTIVYLAKAKGFVE